MMAKSRKELEEKLAAASDDKGYTNAIEKLLPAALEVYGQENEEFVCAKLAKTKICFTQKGESVADAVKRLFPQMSMQMGDGDAGTCVAVPKIGALDESYFLLMDDYYVVVLNSFVDFNTQAGLRVLCRQLFINAVETECDTSGKLLIIRNGIRKEVYFMRFDEEGYIETYQPSIRFERINEGFSDYLQDKMLKRALPGYEYYEYPYGYYIAKLLCEQTDFGKKVLENKLYAGRYKLEEEFDSRLAGADKNGWGSLCSSLDLHEAVGSLFGSEIDRTEEKLHRDIQPMIDAERGKVYQPGEPWSMYKILLEFLQGSGEENLS